MLQQPPAPNAEEPALEVPPMRIVVLLSGTQGDTMPFIQIAHMMRERYGHVVRIATHDDLRAPVEKAGLRFFPLKGNSRQMAGWGPSFSLHIPTLLKLMVDVPGTVVKLRTIRAIVLATIRACTEPDPADPSGEPFHADAIMANPMSVSAIHCAEALGIPCHLFFPNPWVATVEYPHSFSSWGYPSKPAPGTPNGFSWVSSRAHFWSYRMIDLVLFHTFLSSVNELRAICGLRTLRLGFAGSTLVRDLEVPFSQMWSPSLCPRPADWPHTARVTGFFFWDQKASEVDETSAEYAPVVAWLAAGEKPIYIGFGSMVFDGPRTARLIVEAARLSGKRVLMQTSTDGGKLELPELPPNVFCIGRCAHDWLLPKMAAVIHHGGAGTVGTGLKLALPSMCCPFFGDQFFYGHCIGASGCGPMPIPFSKLSAAGLAAALEDILLPAYAEGAKAMARRINAERGIENGIADFDSNLPLADMVCDVATWMHERALARHYYPALRLKVSDEVDATLRSSTAVDRRLLAARRPHVTRKWHLGAHVRDPCTGLCTGALALVWELCDALIALLSIPVKGAAHNGLAGLLLGLVASWLLLCLKLVYAPLICLDRLATGVANCACFRGRDAPLDHVVDPEPALNRIAQAPRGKQSLCGPHRVRDDAGHADGASRLPLHGPVLAAEGPRRTAIEDAFTQVVALRRAFDALDAPSKDGRLSASEVAALATSSGELAAAAAAQQDDSRGSSPRPAVYSSKVLPFSAEKLPALADAVGGYMRKHGRAHLPFADFVLLSRSSVSKSATR